MNITKTKQKTPKNDLKAQNIELPQSVKSCNAHNLDPKVFEIQSLVSSSQKCIGSR